MFLHQFFIFFTTCRKNNLIILINQFKFLSLQKRIVMSMKTRAEYIDILQNYAPELQTRFGITSMRMFGSVARDEHQANSDIDLFVSMPPVFYKYIEASQFLEEVLGCGVDLIQDHKNIRPFFRQQIEQDGIDVFQTTSSN